MVARRSLFLGPLLIAAGLIIVISMNAGEASAGESEQSPGADKSELRSSFSLNRPAQAVAISPSGDRIAVLGDFGTDIRILDTKGHLLRDIPRSGTTADTSLEFLNDDEALAPAGDDAGPDAMLQAWEATGQGASRAVAGSSPGGGPLLNRAKKFSVSRDGSSAVVLADRRNADRVTLVNLQTGHIRDLMLRPALGPFDRISSIALSSDGQRIAVGTTGGRLVVVAAYDGAVLLDHVVYPPAPIIGVGSVAFSADNSSIATGMTAPASTGGNLGEIPGLQVWDANSVRLETSVNTQGRPVRQIVWAPRSAMLAASVGTEALLTVSLGAKAIVLRRELEDLQALQASSKSPVLAVLLLERVELYVF